MIMYSFTKEELSQIVRGLESAVEELDAVEELESDFVLTVGAREEIDEALIIIESALGYQEQLELEGLPNDEEIFDDESP